MKQFFLFLLILSSINIYSQSMQKKDFVLSLGMQRIAPEKYDISIFIVELSANYFAVDIVKDKLLGSVGLYGRFNGFEQHNTDTAFYAIEPGVSVGLHYLISDRFTAFLAPEIGYNIYKANNLLPKDYENSLVSDIQIGGRYFFNQKFAIYLSHYIAKFGFAGGISLRF